MGWFSFKKKDENEISSEEIQNLLNTARKVKLSPIEDNPLIDAYVLGMDGYEHISFQNKLSYALQLIGFIVKAELTKTDLLNKVDEINQKIKEEKQSQMKISGLD